MSESIPLKVQAAVSKFEAARVTLESFREHHRALMEEYDMLREAYNAALTEAKEVYRQHYEQVGSRLGDFSIRRRKKIDAEKLLQLMGPKADALVKMEWKVLRSEYNRAVASGAIPSEVIKEVEIEEPPAVHGPKPL